MGQQRGLQAFDCNLMNIVTWHKQGSCCQRTSQGTAAMSKQACLRGFANICESIGMYRFVPLKQLNAFSRVSTSGIHLTALVIQIPYTPESHGTSNTCTCVHVCTRTCTHVHVYVYMYMCTICMYLYIRIYIVYMYQLLNNEIGGRNSLHWQ